MLPGEIWAWIDEKLNSASVLGRARAAVVRPDWKHFLPLQICGRAPLEVEGMPRRMEDVLTLTLRRT